MCSPSLTVLTWDGDREHQLLIWNNVSGGWITWDSLAVAFDFWLIFKLIPTLATGSRTLPDTFTFLVKQGPLRDLSHKLSRIRLSNWEGPISQIERDPSHNWEGSVSPADPPVSHPPCPQVHTAHAPQIVLLHQFFTFARIRNYILEDYPGFINQ